MDIKDIRINYRNPQNDGVSSPSQKDFTVQILGLYYNETQELREKIMLSYTKADESNESKMKEYTKLAGMEHEIVQKRKVLLQQIKQDFKQHIENDYPELAL